MSMSISTLAPPSSSYWVSAPEKTMAGRQQDAEFGSRQAVDPFVDDGLCSAVVGAEHSRRKDKKKKKKKKKTNKPET
jgi:hypothetical protein